ncbi:MAG: hypothetical protein IJH60_07285 [Eubacterium sp.]|nr:hypothetical protein [Eubacterium sp.]
MKVPYTGQDHQDGLSIYVEGDSKSLFKEKVICIYPRLVAVYGNLDL